MAGEALQMSIELDVDAGELFAAWLSSEEHTAFTGGKAEIDAREGGLFSAWDGYISGHNVMLDHGRRIVQSWRTTEFPEDATDSRLDLTIEPVRGGAKLTLLHSELPEGGAVKYTSGWETHYFVPMLKYFGMPLAETEAAPEKKPATDGAVAAPKTKAAKKKKAAPEAKAAAAAPAKKAAKKKKAAPKAKAAAAAAPKTKAAKKKKAAPKAKAKTKAKAAPKKKAKAAPKKKAKAAPKKKAKAAPRKKAAPKKAAPRKAKRRPKRA